MKRRLFAFITAAAVIVSVSACGNQNTGDGESIPAIAGAEESTSPEETAHPSPSAEPEETSEPEESADPYGLGAAVSDINWDAVVYDRSGDLMEDGWPSIYQNLAQTVAAMYGLWEEYGWHLDANGSELAFVDVIVAARAQNEYAWDSYEDISAELVELGLGARAETPFQMDSETKRLLTELDKLTMEQLAEIIESPEFQEYASDECGFSHNTMLMGNIAEQQGTLLADGKTENPFATEEPAATAKPEATARPKDENATQAQKEAEANAAQKAAEEAAAKAEAERVAAEEAARKAAEEAAAKKAAEEAAANQQQGSQSNSTADVTGTTPVVPATPTPVPAPTPAPHEHSWTPIYETRTTTVVVTPEWFEPEVMTVPIIERHSICDQCGADCGVGVDGGYYHIMSTDCTSTTGQDIVVGYETYETGMSIWHQAVTEERTEQVIVGYTCGCGATK